MIRHTHRVFALLMGFAALGVGAGAQSGPARTAPSVWQSPAVPAAQPASWAEIRSENFVLRGEISAADGKAFLKDLEVFRAGALQMLGEAQRSGELTAAPAAVSIFVIKHNAHAARMLGSPPAAGFYQKDLGGLVLVLNGGAGLEPGGQARLLALRSVADHIMTARRDVFYPPWLREGLTEYFSVADISRGGIAGGSMQAGLYNERHAYPLRGGTWIRMRDMIQPVHETRLQNAFASDDDIDWYGQFSAQSWLAVHYIMSNPNLAAALPDYLSRIAAGQSPRSAFKSAFGQSDKRFERRLKSYARNREFGGRAVNPAEPLGAVSAKALTVSEQNYYAGTILMQGVSDGESLAYAESHIAGLSVSGDLGSAVLAARAVLAEQKGGGVAADVHLAAALKAEPNNIAALRAASTLAFGRFGESADPDYLAQLRGHAEAILAQFPTDPQASYFYAAACAALDCPVDEAARAAFYGASPALEYAGANLNLIPALLAGGETDNARAIAEIAATWGETPEIRQGGVLALKDVYSVMKTRK